MSKNILAISMMVISSNAVAQIKTTFSGQVIDQAGESLIGATVQIKGTQGGTTTDGQGLFNLKSVQQSVDVIISYVGFTPDTVSLQAGQFETIALFEESTLSEVEISAESTFIDNLDPLHKEIITEAELLKAACCNLSESFETNASVDVSFTDAVTGSKQLALLGLSGRYVQINRENTPYLRGLTTRYGLNFVPGTWVQAIDVSKGAGSVVNGYESMTGQLNLELKKPEGPDHLYLNGYVNSFGRSEVNANFAAPIGEKTSTAWLVHGDYFDAAIDRNEDNFMDLPRSRQFNVLNRYKYRGDRWVGQLGVQALVDEKAGGQVGFDFGESAANSTNYGYSSLTRRFELFGKIGLLFPEKPYEGWGFIYTLAHMDVNQGYGRNPYSGDQDYGHVNVIYQNILGNSFHQYKTGVSFQYDAYQEALSDSAFSRIEKVPGIYYEYSYLPSDRLSLVLGQRVDFHNLYGAFYTPRMHIRYQPAKSSTLRLSAGKGYRVANTIAEYGQNLVSSRALIVTESLAPEISWNYGFTLSQQLSLGERESQLIVDYFYTDFQNQIIADLDSDPGVIAFVNLTDRSFANSFQIELATPLTDRIETKWAYKFYDVQTTIGDELRQQPYVSRHRGFFNAAYATKYDIWTVDATLQWYGAKRLPDTSLKPQEFTRPTSSPDFFQLNFQVSKKYRWGTLYLGGENMLDFRQTDPIIDPQQPFGSNFDGTIVWGPVAGRMVYVGYRYKIKKQ